MGAAAAALPPLPPGFTLDSAPDANSSAPPLPSGFTLDAPPPAAAPVTYDAALFRQRVGRNPEPAELANFQASKGVGWAGDPGDARFTLGQAAGGAAEDAAAIGTGTLASVPAAFQYVKTLGLTLDPQAAAAAADATQSKYSYQPRTAAGQAGLAGIGQVAGAPIQTAGAVATAGLNKLDPSGNLATTAGEIAGGIGHVLPLAPVAVEASLLSRGAGVTRGALTTAANAVKGGEIPAGTEFDAAGNLITSKPAPVGAASASDANTIGASAATPPRFAAEAPSPPPTAAEVPALPPGFTLDAPTTSAADVQAQRAATLKAVGLDETDMRKSAVSGDAKAAATDYQQSKLDNEGGQVMSDAFAKERETLGNYTSQLVADAGGSSGLDETSLHNRGSTILQPLQDLSDHLDTTISQLYQRADAAAQGQPLELGNTAKVLGNRAEFIGTTAGQQLLRGANAFLRQSGIADDAGTIGNATVQQAERFKQYLNNQWSPQSARLVRSLKDAIDDDVTSSAGGDIYAAARQARAARANLLDNPKGVASLLDTSGPNGINRAVNVERVPDAIARMPVDQFGHIVDTLQRMPLEMQPQANAALGEIRSQLMQRMQEKAQTFKGPWNNRGVTQYLNANSAKLAKVFSPSELERMRTLNDAGHVLAVDRSYPGTVVQGHNLMQRATIGAIKHGMAAAGGAIAHGPGAVVGETLGGMMSKAVGGSFSRAAARSRFVKP
jgi:hypothetical protein